MNTIPFVYRRILGYSLGFILFFGPLAIFQRGLLFLFGRNYDPTIHTLCFRIPIEHLLNSKFYVMGSVSVTGTILLLIAAFFFGPVFCGRLCPAGAAPEYLSRLLPRRFQINWGNYVPIAALRYGFLAGFIISPLAGGYLACSYCNYYVFDLLVNYWFWNHAIVLSSSLLLTFILWFFVFGIFTQGGRGFCTFFCPVGALQNFVYFIGYRLPFKWKLSINDTPCVRCKKCVNICPMTALSCEKSYIERNVHACILCMECVNGCPVSAIRYGKGSDGGEDHENEM